MGGGGAGDGVAGGGRAGEGDGADPPVLHQPFAHLDVAGDELDGLGRQPRLAQQVHQPERGERGGGGPA
ncbi:hypothetical protein GCM10020001_089170 [Nonomuraea salmonea]